MLNVLGSFSMISLLFIFVLLLLAGLLVWINRQTQEQYRLQSRLQAIVSTSLDAIVVVDRSGRILGFNEAAEEIFGYSRAEAVGEFMENLIVPKHMVDAHRAGIDRYRKTGDPRVIGKGRIQLEARRKTGEVFPTEMSISTAQSADGEIFVSFIRDISTRVSAEKELIKARDDAVEGERAKANVLAIMSHEMRTPLNGMLGTLELFDREDLTTKQMERINIIRGSGQQLLHHVNNVLNISRADSGKIETTPEIFFLEDLISEVVESQRAVAEFRGNSMSHHVSINCQGSCRGDAGRLPQVLLNLIANAIKFTRDGHISVTVNRVGHDDLVDFRVTDTGIGIAAADRDRIFDDFVTVDTSYGRLAGGTGLGLGISKRLIAAMGGKIGVESSMGKGSSFWFQLSLPEVELDPEDQASPTKESALAQNLRALQSLKILVVEDNSINRTVVRELLEQEGMQVEEAYDGAMGVRLADENSYDLVLMDISMPMLDGVEATRQIRLAENNETRVPIVALTAHALPADIERFREGGLDDILVKPISRSSIRNILLNTASAKLGNRSDQPNTIFASALPLIDQAHLSELTATLGKDRLAPLLEQFEIEMEHALNTLDNLSRSDLSGGDPQSMVHHVAGSAALLGASKLRWELVAIEKMLLLFDTAGGEYDAASLRANWDETRSALRTHCQRNQPD
jgi:PAS domain S-box-containing protein